MLPPAIRQPLWPYIERRPAKQSARPRVEIMAQLLRSNPSIMLNLEELRQRAVIPADPAGTCEINPSALARGALLPRSRLR